MWIVLVVGVLAVAIWMARINARYEARQKLAADDDADARVDALWDVFGLPDARPEADVTRLLEEVTPDALRGKHAVIALAIMAARTGHVDVLEALAARARQLDAGCGEAAALGVLAAAYNGDVALARERHARSQSSMAGCGSCGASGNAKILMQEVALALDALESGALTPAMSAPPASSAPSVMCASPVIAPSPTMRLSSAAEHGADDDEAPHGRLHVNVRIGS